MLDILTEDYHKAGKAASAAPPVGLPPEECAAAADAGSTAVIDMRNAPPPIEPVQWVPPEPPVSTPQVQASPQSPLVRLEEGGEGERPTTLGFVTPASSHLYFLFCFGSHADMNVYNDNDSRRHPRPVRAFVGCAKLLYFWLGTHTTTTVTLTLFVSFSCPE